jgi:hypothetical protein
MKSVSSNKKMALEIFKIEGSKKLNNKDLKNVLRKKITNFVNEIEKYNDEIQSTRDLLLESNLAPQISK